MDVGLAAKVCQNPRFRAIAETAHDERLEELKTTLQGEGPVL